MEWKIKQGGEECAQCKKFFIQGEEYFSTVLVEEGLLQRTDYCEACFEALDPENRASFWKTRKTQVKEVKKTVNFELLRELYFKMLTMKEKEIKELAYLIGLILVRKRFLKLKNFVSEEDGDFMLVQQKKDAPVVRMEVPLLAEEDIAVLRDRLSDLLDTDLGSMLDPHELREKFAAPANGPAQEAAPAESSMETQADASGEGAEDRDPEASEDTPKDAPAERA